MLILGIIVVSILVAKILSPETSDEMTIHIGGLHSVPLSPENQKRQSEHRLLNKIQSLNKKFHKKRLSADQMRKMDEELTRLDAEYKKLTSEEL